MTFLQVRNHTDATPLTATRHIVNFLEGNHSNPCYLLPNIDTVDKKHLLNHLNLQTFLNSHSTQLLSMKLFDTTSYPK